jgi:beta-galactosidase GanA
MKSLILVFCLSVCIIPVCTAATKADPSAPHLEKIGHATQLIVDGKPYLALAGELHNSSSSSLEYLKPIWPKMTAMNLNTVLASVCWDCIEPEEGKFDFSVVDGIIHGARENNLHLVLLWFGSWKNGVSTYPPLWVKTDSKRFPRAHDQEGNALEILSTFSKDARDADAHAFAALMRHLREIDATDHTVLMVQVENEVGVLGDTRDRSPVANQAFAGPVPKELMNYLQQHRADLIPEFRQVWENAGGKTSGTWEQVFGSGKPADIKIPVRTLSPPLTEQEHETEWRNLHWPVDEIFMAWQYASYVNHVAEAGKAEYNIPMYVNAWLQQRDHAWPGTYPSGGPLPQVMDIWHFAAPNIDILGPDLYVPEFEELCQRYTREGNPLFIPESAGDARGAANFLDAIGSHNGIGFSPFGIDSDPAPDGPLARAYGAVAQLAPMILKHQQEGTIEGTALSKTHTEQTLNLGDYAITFKLEKFWNREAPDYGSAIVMETGHDEFLIAANGVTVYFSPKSPGTDKKIVGLGTVEEGSFADGKWVPGRHLNGDEILSGKGLRFRPDGYSMERVKLYTYE